MPVLFTFNLQTKFEMPSFAAPEIWPAPKNVKMSHVTLTTVVAVSHQKANTSRGQLVYKI